MIDECYKVDYLFLLVGTNPLPNYVAARLLVRDPQQSCIFFVYSNQTSEPRRSLENLLKQHSYTQFVDVKVEEANPTNIRNRVTARAKGLSGKVGLNYTGGTKAMSVYTYLALESLTRPDPNDRERSVLSYVQYSYLDARMLSMWIEGSGIAPGTSLVIDDVAQRVSVSIQEMLELHGLNQLKKQMNRQTIWEHVSDALAKIHGEKHGEETWRDWCTKTLRRQDRRDKFISPGTLKLLTTDALPFEQVREAFQREYPSRNLPITFKELAKSSRFGRADESMAKWFDGAWLEHYVFRQLQPLEDAKIVHDLVMTINPYLPSENAQLDFEFDVACVRGYQLFAISCTSSSDPKLCKSKLLEAVVRAEQLGGSEARVALVCCVDTPTHIRDQVSALFHKDRVQVFGRPQLHGLKQCLAEWITDSSRSE